MPVKYSIISALIRPEIKEKISVGIIMFDEQNIHFKYSVEKLAIAKELLSDTGYKVLKEVLKNIEYKIQIDNPIYWENKGFDLFPMPKQQFFSVEYVNYLSRYSNNSMAFSEPKLIELPATLDTLVLLFEKYVNSGENNNHKKPLKLVEVISKKYKSKVEKMFDVQKEVTHKTVPNLITPVTIDFCGKNGVDVYVQTLNMESKTNVIANDINCLFQLKSIYEQNKKPIKDFIIASEPPKRLVKQHDIWNQIRTYKSFDYVDISEVGKVFNYAESHGVKPISQAE